MIRLYLIGMLMGIADLIPGVSGGTVAFLSGIYEELLLSIKTLKLQSFKKIAWPFLVPLFLGIVTSVLSLSRLFYFLMIHFKGPLFGLFFGLIAGSTVMCAKEANLKKPSQLFVMSVAAIASFIISGLPTNLLFGTSFVGLSVAGMLATGAMLLPGISGTFVLQVLGVYPLAIAALANPSAWGSIGILITLALGIACGFIVFSRLIHTLLLHFHQMTFAVLVGLMVGGLKTLWPFETSFFTPISFTLLGFAAVIFLETKAKRLRAH